MDEGALIVVVGIGALIDALADINQGKEVVVTLLAASLMLLILSALGRATGQYGFATALAFLYLLASLFKNWDHVPAITGLFTTPVTPVNPGTATQAGTYSTANSSADGNGPRSQQVAGSGVGM